jgi:DNA-binding IclR family transcriptional regulator
VKRHSTKPTTARRPGTQSVTRAFAILRVFSDARREWSLADVSRTLALTKPTALRLLGALEREGMVQRARQNGLYRLGATMIQLGALAQRSIDLPTSARAELEQLAARTGETASLEMLAGTEILVLDEVRGPSRGSASEFVGARWPAHAAATGKVLLAAARAEEGDAWRQFLAATQGRLPRYTEHTITRLARFGQELTAVLERGYGTAIEELEPGYVAIGAPVRNHAGRVVAAICLGGPSTRLSESRRPTLIRAVVLSAGRISARLGAAPQGHKAPARALSRRRRLVSR